MLEASSYRSEGNSLHNCVLFSGSGACSRGRKVDLTRVRVFHSESYRQRRALRLSYAGECLDSDQPDHHFWQGGSSSEQGMTKRQKFCKRIMQQLHGAGTASDCTCFMQTRYFFFKGKRKNGLKVVTKTKKTPSPPSGFMACGRWSHPHFGGFQGAKCSQGRHRCSLEHRGEGASRGENDSKRDVGDDILSSRRPSRYSGGRVVQSMGDFCRAKWD